MRSQISILIQSDSNLMTRVLPGRALLISILIQSDSNSRIPPHLMAMIPHFNPNLVRFKPVYRTVCSGTGFISILIQSDSNTYLLSHTAVPPGNFNPNLVRFKPLVAGRFPAERCYFNPNLVRFKHGTVNQTCIGPLCISILIQSDSNSRIQRCKRNPPHHFNPNLVRFKPAMCFLRWGVSSYFNPNLVRFKLEKTDYKKDG